jgi:hypothetical protein
MQPWCKLQNVRLIVALYIYTIATRCTLVKFNSIAGICNTRNDTHLVRDFTLLSICKYQLGLLHVRQHTMIRAFYDFPQTQTNQENT